MHLSHIPQYTIQNDALWDMGQVNSVGFMTLVFRILQNIDVL